MSPETSLVIEAEVFIRYFESGGTLPDFNQEKVGDCLVAQFQKLRPHATGRLIYYAKLQEILRSGEPSRWHRGLRPPGCLSRRER
jgi:hypothetical protein